MRIKGLDFLRGIAILGVLFRHFEIDFFLSGPGGYGVDLFFVLSGFLVSGLLFAEYKNRRQVNISRFLIRRGFKIYPAFYFFIAAAICIYYFGFGSTFEVKKIFSEIFFLQSYLRPMWSHTWSLAVEEHFYLLLSLLVYLSIRRKWLDKPAVMMVIFTTGILIPFLLRFTHVISQPANNLQPFYYTHLRMDGLFTGACLGYIWHFKPELIARFNNHTYFFMTIALLLIAPAFILIPENFIMLTAGFNLIHLGFAIILLIMIGEKGEKLLNRNAMIRAITNVIAAIGVYSYSIYLWHMTVQNILLRYFTNLWTESLLYLIVAIGTGYFTAKCIERPLLRLRDRYFPSKSSMK